MNKKMSLYIVSAILALCLLIAGFFVDIKKISGIMIGIGAGVFSCNISLIFNLLYMQKHPEHQKQSAIELKDERNIMIRNQAKAKAADIMQWVVVALTYVTILISSPLWFTLLVVMLVPAYYLIVMVYTNKYQREL
jgi:uncharacterized ion transporter superfamily protein YfcC